MITAPQIRTLLDGLARRFENRPQFDSEGSRAGALGWGQFLDGQPKHNQVGPYGTCSGIIARVLAGRGPDELDRSVGILIEEWWKTRDEDKGRHFGQTIRLAMLHLALRLKNDPTLGWVLKEVEETLLGNIRADSMWGNYQMPGSIQDPSPRLIASCLAVLSFTLFRPVNDPWPPVLIETVKKIEDRILGTDNLPRLHVAIASAAILSIPSHRPSSASRSRISKLAYSTQRSLPDLGVYFYDFESEENGKRIFRTDYFIVPTELVLGIAGYQVQAPSYLRFRAEGTMSLLVRNLQGFDGFYRPDNEQRISSVNQAWVAMYLALAERALSVPGSPGFHVANVFPRVFYACIRQRPDRFWLDSVMLSICAIGALCGSLVQFPGLTVLSIASKICVVILTFLAGRLYAPIFIKKVFAERQ
jgi:hypothetical protein